MARQTNGQQHTVWRIELFGGLRVSTSLAGTPCPDALAAATAHSSRKHAHIAAFLAYYPGFHERRHLARVFYDMEAALGNMSVDLSHIKRFLADYGAPESILEYRNNGRVHEIGFSPERVSTDVARFREALLRVQQAASSQQSEGQLREAIALYRGALTGDRWLITERRENQDAYGWALASLIGIHLHRNAVNDVVELLDYPIDHLLLSQSTFVALFALLAASVAPSQLQRLAQRLEHRLHVARAEPVPEIRALVSGQSLSSPDIPLLTLPERFLAPCPPLSLMPSSMPRAYLPIPEDNPLSAIVTMRQRGKPQQAVAALRRLLDRGSLDPDLHVSATVLLSDALRDIGDLGEASDVLEHIVSSAAKQPHTEAFALAQARLGLIYQQTGRPSEASTLAQTALKSAETHGWSHVAVAARSLLAYLLENSGERTAALAELNQALQWAEAAGDVNGRITTLSDMARIEGLLGEYRDAIDHLAQSTSIASQAQLTRYVLENRHREALLKHAAGERETAQSIFDQLLLQTRAHSQRRLECEVLHSQARLRMERHDYVAAQRLLQAAMELAISMELSRNLQFLRLDMAYAANELGHPEQALDLYRVVWEALQPIQLTHAEMIGRFLREVKRVLAPAERDTFGKLTTEFYALYQPAGIYGTTQVLERQRHLEQIASDVNRILGAGPKT